MFKPGDIITNRQRTVGARYRVISIEKDGTLTVELLEWVHGRHKPDRILRPEEFRKVKE